MAAQAARLFREGQLLARGRAAPKDRAFAGRARHLARQPGIPVGAGRRSAQGEQAGGRRGAARQHAAERRHPRWRRQPADGARAGRAGKQAAAESTSPHGRRRPTAFQEDAVNRVKARFELIDLLVKQDIKRPRRRRPLPLQDEVRADLDAAAHRPSDSCWPDRPGEPRICSGRSFVRSTPRRRGCLCRMGEAEIAQGTPDRRNEPTDSRSAETRGPEHSKPARTGSPGTRPRSDAGGPGTAERFRRTCEAGPTGAERRESCAGAGASEALRNLA